MVYMTQGYARIMGESMGPMLSIMYGFQKLSVRNQNVNLGAALPSVRKSLPYPFLQPVTLLGGCSVQLQPKYAVASTFGDLGGLRAGF